MNTVKFPDHHGVEVRMICPLCGAPVHYEGLNNIECVGVGCQNYKPLSESEKKSSDIYSFDDTPIDWAWIQSFRCWLNQQGVRSSVRKVRPPLVREELLEITFPQNCVPGVTLQPGVTRRELYFHVSSYFDHIRGRSSMQ